MSKNIKFFSDLDVKGELKVANLNASNLTVEIEGYSLKDKFNLIDSALTELEKDIDAISSSVNSQALQIEGLTTKDSELTNLIEALTTSVNNKSTVTFVYWD